MKNKIKNILKGLSWSLFLFWSSAAVAASFQVQCVTPAEMDSMIEFCTDNIKATQSAAECRNAMKQVFDEAGPELKRIYDLEKDAYTNHQKKEFHFSRGDYERAQAKLDYLIDEAEENLDRIAAYPPVMLDAPEPEERVPCFTENYSQVEKATLDLDNMISELKKTRDLTSSLRTIVTESDGNIEHIPIPGEETSRTRTVGFGGGNSKNNESDVTGTQESKAKRRNLASMPAGNNKLGRPDGLDGGQKQEKSAAKNFDTGSYISQSSVQRQALESFSDPMIDKRDSGTASGRGAKGTASSFESQRNAASVGALLWEEPGDSSKVDLQLKLPKSETEVSRVHGASNDYSSNLGSESGASGQRALASNSFPDQDSDSGEIGASRNAEKTAAAATTAPMGALLVARSDEDLFAVVHDCYRKSDLFRGARILSVPLESFDPGLKK